MLIYRAGDMLNAAKQFAPDLYTTCRSAKRRVPAIRRTVKFSEKVMQDIPEGSIEKFILEQKPDIKVYRIMIL